MDTIGVKRRKLSQRQGLAPRDCILPVKPTREMPAMNDMETVESGLSEHIQQAIVQNKARRRYYQRQGGMHAYALMTKLIWMETAILPFAQRLDRQAQVFRDQGIPVLQAELSPISASPDITTPVPVVRKLHRKDYLEARKWASEVSRKTAPMALAHDFSGISGQTESLIAKVHEQERTKTVRFALFMHIVESMSHFAACGDIFCRQSNGATAPLTATVIKAHARALGTALTMDKWANTLHRKGLGIFINDLPAIPFNN